MSDSLQIISTQLAQILSPIIILVGVIGNILNIFVLTRPNFRDHSCCRYFLALSSNNLFYCLFQVSFYLANAYSLDGQYVSLVACKILQYIASVSSFLSPYLIIFASIDRFCSSSPHVKIRSLSSLYITHRSILVLISLTGLFFINIFIFYDLREDDGLGCNMRGDELYKQIFIITQVVLYAGLPPCLMIIFGLLTAWNMKRMKNLGRNLQRYRRRDTQFMRMLFIQVLGYLILNVPLCILYLMLVLPFGYSPTEGFFFAYTILSYPFNFSYATPFFLYILSARMYREEFFKLMKKVLPCCVRKQVEPVSLLNRHRHLTKNPSRPTNATTTL